MIRPQPLQPGDCVAIVSPAGAVKEPEIVTGAVATLSSWGLRAVVAPHALARDGYYAGTIEQRTADLRAMLRDDSIKAILCSYGGYGCMHLLPHFCSDIANHPKWIIGMSDCTALLAAALSQGVISLHSQQCRHLAENGESTSSEHLREILFGRMPHYQTASNRLNRTGEATGVVTGGNLSLIATLAGTPYDMVKPGSILFLEEVNEPAYKIERMLYTLKLSGALGSLKALIVGSMTNCKENLALGGTIHEIIRHMTEEYGYPICFDFPVGHGDENYPMPVGATATIKIKNDGVELSYTVV